MKYLLGVDLGTSGTKTVLFDEKGSAIASRTVEYPLYQPHNGWAEQDPLDWYNAAVSTIKGVLEDSGIDPHKVAALSIAGQMHGLVMLDEQGQVLRKSILWCDARTQKQCDEITALVGKKRLIEINANPALTGFTAPKILWVREHEPELYQRCATILLPKDYVRYMLTGKAAMEISDASGTSLLDITRRQWSEEIMEKLSIDARLMPELTESSAIAGHISAQAAAATGLVEGTPVAGGAGDNAAAALGTGVCSEGQAFVTLGTSGVVFAHTPRPAVDPLGRVHTFCAAVPGSWTAMSCTLAAGLSLRWARDELYTAEHERCQAQGGDAYDVMTAEAASVPSGADGLIYLPYLMGERSPVLDAQARGVFFGLTARHKKAHLTRAVLEGITLSQRHNLEVLHQMGIVPETLAACGGGGRSPFWRQMLADVLKCQVTTIESKEGPALGAAILAAVAAGIYPTVEQAVAVMVKRGEAWAQPDALQSSRYDDIYQLYQSLYPTMRPAFHKLAALRDRLDSPAADAASAATASAAANSATDSCGCSCAPQAGSAQHFSSVHSVEFERFGKVIPAVDTAKVSSILESLPCPADSVTYVASEPALQTDDLMADLRDRVFGGLDIQIGYCSGHNRKLNAIEYHRNCEVNIVGTDTIFMLAPLTAIRDGIMDTAAVETFFCPAGTAVLFYETTLHYAPCSCSDNAVFRVAVVLPRSTNTQKPEHIDARGDAESGMLTARNKWLLAHPDSNEGRNHISTGVLTGANITL